MLSRLAKKGYGSDMRRIRESENKNADAGERGGWVVFAFLLAVSTIRREGWKSWAYSMN